MTPTSAALLRALEQMPPRAAHILRKAALDGLDLESLGEAYGVSPQAAGVLLLRSVRALDAALLGQDPRPLPYEHELAELPSFLDGWRRGARDGPAASLGAVTAVREELEDALSAAAAAAEAAPRRRREAWLRWTAVAIIVALSAYLYWRDELRGEGGPPPRALSR